MHGHGWAIVILVFGVDIGSEETRGKVGLAGQGRVAACGEGNVVVVHVRGGYVGGEMEYGRGVEAGCGKVKIMMWQV